MNSKGNESFGLTENRRGKARIEYRSPGLEAGALNRIGLPHVHIDGARDQALVLEIVKELEAKGDLGKFNLVIQSVAGKQRAELPEVYESHTPMLEGQEALDFFSSNIVQDRNDAIQCVNLIGEKIKNIPGCIVELEQVVGWYGPKGWEWIESGDEMEPINPEEVDFKPQPTWSYELHHGFNLPKDSDKPPVELVVLRDDCEKAGITLGGWFVFDKGKEWAYRSNSFSESADIRTVVEQEQASLNVILAQYGKDTKARTLVERVLGIWHSQGQ